MTGFCVRWCAVGVADFIVLSAAPFLWLAVFVCGFRVGSDLKEELSGLVFFDATRACLSIRLNSAAERCEVFASEMNFGL